jgi:NifU-like protein involved in Fe-S cluster formation
MDVHLTVIAGVIREATFETYQCPGCHACGRSICELTLGKTLEEAQGITHPILVSRVGLLPRHRQICYGLALLALSDALEKL